MKPNLHFPVLVVLCHLALVPVAIVGTRLAFGYQNMLTLENQVTWTPAFAAQRVLIAIVFGLGTGAFFKRSGICLVALVAITAGTNLARASLTTLGPNVFETMLLCCLRDLPNALPSLAVAVSLLTVRSIMGVIGNQTIHRNQSQFGIKDLVVLLTVVAAVAAVCRWVIIDPRIPNPNFAALSVGACISLAGTIGAVLLTLSARFQWLGLLMLTTAITTSIIRSIELTPLWFGVLSQAYLWALVLLTLAALRCLGFSLQSIPGLNRSSTSNTPTKEGNYETHTKSLAYNMAQNILRRSFTPVHVRDDVFRLFAPMFP